MSELGRFLETVYGPTVPFQTVHAVVRHWRNETLMEYASGGGRTAMGRKKPLDQEARQNPKIKESCNSIWLKQLDKIRIEGNDGPDENLVVVNGDRWWHRKDGQVETNEGQEKTDDRCSGPALTCVERHFDHKSLREYFVALSLELVDSTAHAGINCIRIRAVRRPDSQLWPHWLPSGADDYEFIADPNHGALLGIKGRFQGEVFESYQIEQVTFDAELPEILFTFTPKPDDQRRPPDVIAEHLSLDEAVQRMPFTVLFPTSASKYGFRAREAIYHPPRPGSLRSSLLIFCRGEHTLWVDQSDSADPKLEKLEFEQFQRNGFNFSISDPGDGLKILTMETRGTHVKIYSDLDCEELIDIASSLEPVKAG